VSVVAKKICIQVTSPEIGLKHFDKLKPEPDPTSPARLTTQVLLCRHGRTASVACLDKRLPYATRVEFRHVSEVLPPPESFCPPRDLRPIVKNVAASSKRDEAAGCLRPGHFHRRCNNNTPARRERPSARAQLSSTAFF